MWSVRAMWLIEWFEIVWSLCPDSKHTRVASLCDSCLRVKSSLTGSELKLFSSMSGFHVVVYFGRDEGMLNIPFMYLRIIGSLPSVRPLIGSIKADRAEWAVYRRVSYSSMKNWC